MKRQRAGFLVVLLLASLLGGCARTGESKPAEEPLQPGSYDSWLGSLPGSGEVLFAPGYPRNRESVDALGVAPLLRVDLSTGKARSIRGSRSGLGGGVVAPSRGRALLGYLVVRNPADPGLRLFSVGSDDLKELPHTGTAGRETGGYYGLVISTDERRAAGQFLKSRDLPPDKSSEPKTWTPPDWDSEVILVDILQGKAELTGLKSAAPLCWSLDGDTVFCVSATGIRALNVRTRAVSTVSSRGDIVRVFPSAKLKALVAVSVEKGGVKVELLRGDFTTQRLVARLSDNLAHVTISPDGGRLAYRDIGGRMGVIDLETSEVRKLGTMPGNLGPEWGTGDTLITGNSQDCAITLVGTDGKVKRTIRIDGEAGM